MTTTSGEVLETFLSLVDDLSELAESESPDTKAIKIIGRAVTRLGKVVKLEYTKATQRARPQVTVPHINGNGHSNGNGNGHPPQQPQKPKKNVSGLRKSHTEKLVCKDCDPPRTIIGHGPMGQHRKIAHPNVKAPKGKNRLVGKV